MPRCIALRSLLALAALVACSGDAAPGVPLADSSQAGAGSGGATGGTGAIGGAGVAGGKAGSGEGGAGLAGISGSSGQPGQGGAGAGGAGAGQAGAGQAGAGQAGAGQAGAGQAGAGQAGAGAGGEGAAGQGGAADPCELWGKPEGPYPEQRAPDLSLLAAKEGGEEAATLHGWRSGCEAPGLLVVRVEPSWCGPCGAQADRMASLLSPFEGAGVRAVTVLYAGPDSARATGADLLRFRADHPSLPGDLARPVGAATLDLVRAHGRVPLLLLVDARTMRNLAALRAPRDRELQEAVATALAQAGGPEVALGPDLTALIDGRFDEADWEQIQRMAQPLAPLPSPSNAHADDPAAAALGKKLFDDTALASSAGVSCATCHDPAKGFGDGLPTAQGVAKGRLNSPTVLGAAAQRWLFWDGRADSLWSQALGPLENPLETGGSRLHVAHRVHQAHKAEYEVIFGALPPLDDGKRFPAEGRPGDAAYEAMAADDRELVTRVFVNVGKAIEAHERTLQAPPSRLEAYAAGDMKALSEQEKEGLWSFLRVGCNSCHHGPLLSDGAFHDLLMPSSEPPADAGRIEGLASLLSSPFRKDGPYSDDPAPAAYPPDLLPTDEMLGQIRTPSLRSVAATGPWGHGGNFATLGAVLKHYLMVHILPPQGPQVTGTLDAATGTVPGNTAALVAFLAVLGEPAPP